MNASHKDTFQQFVKLLEENGRSEQARELAFLLAYMDNMSRQFDNVLSELQEVKAQLARAKESPIKKTLGRMADALENNVRQARRLLRNLREKLMSCAAHAMENFKTAGVSALNKAVSAMHVKPMLESLQQKISGMIARTEENMAKVAETGHKLRSAGGFFEERRTRSDRQGNLLGGRRAGGTYPGCCPGPPAGCAGGFVWHEPRHPCRAQGRRTSGLRRRNKGGKEVCPSAPAGEQAEGTCSPRPRAGKEAENAGSCAVTLKKQFKKGDYLLMKTKQYLINGKNYLAHIDGQIEMYDQLLTLANETRELLLDGKLAAVLRTLNKFEHKANETFLSWGISDDYLCSGEPKDLHRLIDRELLEMGEDGCPAADCILRPCCSGCDKDAEKEESRGA